MDAPADARALSARLHESDADPVIVSGLDRLTDEGWRQLDRLRGRITRDRFTVVVLSPPSAERLTRNAPSLVSVFGGFFRLEEAPEAPPESAGAGAAAYGTLGYVVCDDEEHEVGFDEIALFAYPSGEPTHAARQLDATHWTSKVGRLQDIRHPLHALEGEAYGRVVLWMKRTIAASAPPSPVDRPADPR